MTDADEVWNRAALEGGGPEPREGDAALAALLRAHGLTMNGGVLHAAESLRPDELRASCDGYRFFAYDGLATLLADVAITIAKGQGSEALEESTGRAYARSIPDDGALLSRFERHFDRHPELYAPISPRRGSKP
jgi:hypothetical protein